MGTFRGTIWRSILWKPFKQISSCTPTCFDHLSMDEDTLGRLDGCSNDSCKYFTWRYVQVERQAIHVKRGAAEAEKEKIDKKDNCKMRCRLKFESFSSRGVRLRILRSYPCGYVIDLPINYLDWFDQLIGPKIWVNRNEIKGLLPILKMKWPR